MKETRVKLEEKDYRQFLFFHIYRGFKGKMKLALPFILIPVMYASLVQSGRTENMDSLLVVSLIAVAYTAFLPILLMFISKKTYNKSAQLRQEAFYEFAADGLKIRGAAFTGTAEWGKFYAAGITDKAVYLYTSAGKALIVPLRFIDAGTVHEVIALVREKMGRKVIGR